MEMSLEEVFEFIRNGASIKQFNGSGVPITRIETIATGNIDLDKVGYADIFDSKYESYYLKDGDILMSHINSLKHLGKVAIVENLEDNVIHGMNLLCLRPKKMVCPKFILNYFRTQQFNAEILRISKKSVNQASFNITDLKKIKINLPNLEIQNKIADTLDLSSALIEKRKDQIAEMDKLIQSVFYEMFGDPFLNQKSWKIRSIKEVIVKTQYGTSDKASEEMLEFPILRMNNISYSGNMSYSNMKYINLDDKDKEKYLVHKGELLFNRTNSKELVGKTGLFELDTPMAFAGYLIKIIPSIDINPKFMVTYMNTDYIKKVLFNMAKSIVGMANINAKELESIPIIVPPLKLQNKFASIVEEIESQKKVMEESLHEMENNFSALMQKAFRGDLFPEE